MQILLSGSSLPGWLALVCHGCRNDPTSNLGGTTPLNHALEDALPRAQPDWLCTCWALCHGWSLGPDETEEQVFHICGTIELLSPSEPE